MSRTLLTLAALLMVAGSPAFAADTIYKWVDEQGTVHYGERPPEGVDAVEVLVSQVSERDPADNPYASATTADPDQPSVAQQRREERAERIEQQRQEDARLGAACQAQRARLEQLVPRSKVILQNADGTSRMLDDDERLAMIEEAQTFVDENCQDY